MKKEKREGERHPVYFLFLALMALLLALGFALFIMGVRLGPGRYMIPPGRSI